MVAGVECPRDTPVAAPVDTPAAACQSLRTAGIAPEHPSTRTTAATSTCPEPRVRPQAALTARPVRLVHCTARDPRPTGSIARSTGSTTERLGSQAPQAHQLTGPTGSTDRRCLNQPCQMTDVGTGQSIPVVLDHVAVAAETWQHAWQRYVSVLGGTWQSGDVSPGFAPCQLRYANGARLEILAPHDPDANPFLRRFIDRNGPGPHHLTFKVPDLDEAIEAVRHMGIEPVGIDRSEPSWHEAFLHPADGLGIVVQIAQQRGDWGRPAPADFPRPAQPAATLVRATHAVADLAFGESVFVGLLGGTVSARTTSPDGTIVAVDLSWPGPLGLRLVGPVLHPPQSTPRRAAGTEAGTTPEGTPHTTSTTFDARHTTVRALHAWLDGRPGRLHHVVFSVPDPLATPGSHPVTPVHPSDPPAAEIGPGDLVGVLADDRAVALVPASANLGTRLVLTRTNP